MTTFLAIWGAALSTILALFESIRFYLDRPRLQVLPQLNVSVAGAVMRAVVTNRGRRPTTVTEAGFRVLVEHTATVLRTGQQFGIDRWIKLEGTPKVLDAGEMATFEYDFIRNGFPPLVHADFPLRVYTRDLNRRFVWGPAAPIIRLVTNSNLTFPHPPDPLMVDPPLPGAPLKPVPAYARWKVWRGVGVRDPLPLERRLRRMKPRPWEPGGRPEVPSEILTAPVDDNDMSSGA